MKKFTIALLSFIALPAAIQANIDPKVAEMCMESTDFEGCVKSMSGIKKNNLSPKSEYDNALVLFESGNSSGAINAVNKYLEKNTNSKEAYLLRAVINSWALDNAKDAIKDLNKAIELDDQYADAYAVRGNVLYWDLSSAPSAKIDMEKALAISPNNPYINYVYAEYLFDFAYVLIDKNKTDLAINSANEAIKYFEKSILNEGNEEDLIIKRLFPFGIKYESYANIGDIKFELYFWYKDNKQRKIAKETLNNAIIDYSKSIELAPSQEETDQIDIDFGFDYVDLGELYFYRGNAYSWLDNTGRKACKDWKISKKYGNNDAKKNVREWRC